MPRYNLAPIVRPSDLMGRSIHSHVAEAVRNGTARLVGFGSQGEALRLLEAREGVTRISRGDYHGVSEGAARRWVSLADVPGGVACLDEVDAYPSRGSQGPRGGRGVGVTGPSRGGGADPQVSRVRGQGRHR